ncbi:MAG: hypothetical protein FWF53_06795 [Candidatus Azobacteroides sp.]|nr:hypothetical protein [Candidatus Azobacteroides sp.]
MKHLLDILSIPSAIILVAYAVFYFRHRKEIRKDTDKKMKEKYPDWPKVPRQKTHYSVFPLSLWND